MPKRRSRTGATSPRTAIVLAAITLALFAGGEAFLLSRTDSGPIMAARYLGIPDRARITLLIGKQLHRGLEAVGVSSDSVRETVADGAPPLSRWRVGLRPGTALLQAN